MANQLIKQLLGIVVIAGTLSFAETYNPESFLLTVLTTLPFWITLFIFFKFREWTE